MNSDWNITFDPLFLATSTVDPESIEDQAKEQGEDIIQAERAGDKKVILDLGWYGDRYRVFLVENSDWTEPRKEFDSTTLKDALDIFRRLQT
jgi:hypothetical protein